jgi:hypothetical protein
MCRVLEPHRVLPRWLGATGLIVSVVYLLNQGDLLATAVPGFPFWDLAGLLGSTGWGLWVAALGVTVLLRPARTRNSSAATETNGADGVAALDTPFGSTPRAPRPARAGSRS